MGRIAIGEFIPKWYGTQVDLISYGGVNVAHYSSVAGDLEHLPLRIAYLGRFERDTGIEEFVHATKQYCTLQGVKIDLHLFGRGRLEEHFLRLQSDSSLSITVSPPVSDTAKVLEKSPIILASGYLTILESLCARRIVFAYYNNPLREDYLRLHPAASSMFVCGKVQDVMQGLALCRENISRACLLSEPGWQWAREQSWDKLAQRYVDLWHLKK
jgi:hypothetical protein